MLNMGSIHHDKEDVSIHQSLKESFIFSCDDDVSTSRDIACYSEVDSPSYVNGLQSYDVNTHFAWERRSPEDSEKPEIHEFEFNINLSERQMMNEREGGFMDTLFSPADDLFYNGQILPLNHSPMVRGYGRKSIARKCPQDLPHAVHHHSYASCTQDSSHLLIDVLGETQHDLLQLEPWLHSLRDASDDNSLRNHRYIDETLMLFQHQLDLALKMIHHYEPGNSIHYNNKDRGNYRCEHGKQAPLGWANEEKALVEPDYRDDHPSWNDSIDNHHGNLNLELRDSTTNHKSFILGNNVENGLMIINTRSNPLQCSYETSSKRKYDVRLSKSEGKGDGDGDGYLHRKRKGYLNLMKYIVMLKSLFLHIKRPSCRKPRNMFAVPPIEYTVSRGSWSSSSPSLSTSSSTSTSSSASSSVDQDASKVGSSKLNIFKCSKRSFDEARIKSMTKDEAYIQMPSPIEVENFIRGAIEHCKNSSV